jgi:type II secretory pathway pseudopilin PulG
MMQPRAGFPSRAPTRDAPALPPVKNQGQNPCALHRGRACGASLLEVLIALTFIAIFAAGFAGVAVSVVTGNAKAKSTDIGVFLAHDRLEQIRNTAYSSITAANFPDENYGSISIGSPAVSFPDFRRTVAIQDDTPTQGMKRVVVTVSWRGGSLSKEMLVAP